MPSIYNKLLTIGLPVQPEAFLTKEVSLPCITYYCDNDVQDKTGDTLMYSNVYYTIKIWGKRVADLVTYAAQVDTVMRSMGFRRIGTNEIWVDDLGQKIIKYRALGLEEID